ncbi:MAG: chromate transporter [Acinetobacter populi]|jgi:chromate transporter|uniref:chromate transporter n=1 Tax=Acinetobacter populi TaxID=1582270 RepID=UPI0023565E7F|nr:chromate transporter [Acinetobacter populi]MCH4249081.1 chromate transporter [Acinetobacter populi]
MVLISLAIIFIQLSLLAFGGGNAILPEMKYQVVDLQHWLTAQQFAVMFAMSQAAPGPNMMIVPLIGWYVAGLPGLLVATFAKLIPSSLIMIFSMQSLGKIRHHLFYRYFEMALKPITVSLILVSGYLIAEAAAQNQRLIAIIILITLLSYFKNLHPFWLMLLGSGLAILLLN